MLRLFTALVVLVLSTSLPARDYDDWYEVEIILFEHLNPAAIEAEQWPIAPERPELEGTIELLIPVREEVIDEGAEPAAEIPPSQTEEERGGDKTDDEPLPFELLPAESRQLTEHYQTLEAAPEYRPLLHLSWRQIIQGRHRPDRIHLFSGLDEPEQPVTEMEREVDENGLPTLEILPAPALESIANTTENSQPESQWVLDEQGNVINIPLPSLSIDETTIPEVAPLELDGILTLSRGRYIHVESDFLWQVDPIMQEYALNKESGEIPPEESLSPLPQPFEVADEPFEEATLATEPIEEVAPLVEAVRIQGKLRTRSTELQYLDHPMVGMLILFTPYAPPVDEEEEESNSGVETFAIGH